MPLLSPEDPQLVLAADELFAPDLLAPPLEWFYEFPEWFGELETNKVWVDSEGRIAGRTWGWGSCLIDGNESECWTPPVSPTEYEAFHQGATPTRQGAVVPTGVIGGRVGHAPVNLTFDQAARWYANTGDQLMVGRAFDVEHEGGYFLGAVLPTLTVNDVAMIRRSALSCDWRYRLRDAAGNALNAYDNLGPWLVTRPGLPLDRRGTVAMRRFVAAVGAPIEGSTLPQTYLIVPEGDEMPPAPKPSECSCHAPAVTAATSTEAREAQDASPSEPAEPVEAVESPELVALRAEVEAMKAEHQELREIVAGLLMADVTLAEV